MKKIKIKLLIINYKDKIINNKLNSNFRRIKIDANKSREDNS